jgi:glycosyltransferase involved in cell wall biosynthesis
MLAIVDTHFPWMISGFRYWENYEFYNIDKDILFFSVHKMNDPFPTNVYTLPSIGKYPITDIYCVFLNFTLGLLDYPGDIPGKNFWLSRKQYLLSKHIGRKYGLSEFIKRNNISVHTTIYPGGGYPENFLNQAVKGLRFIGNHPNVKNVFTNLSLVQEIIPKAHYVAGMSNVDFYKYIPRVKSDSIQILFACHHRREKGFNYLVKAFNLLDRAKYHLHIAGDWQDELHFIEHDNYTYYGTLPPTQLREVYYKCHIVVTPGYTDDAPPDGFVTIDGFPTGAAVDAMSTGCCLISTNIRKDHRALTPGEDYLEINEKSPEDIVTAIEYLYGNQDKMLSMANSGYRKVLKFFDVKKNVAFKHSLIEGRNI